MIYVFDDMPAFTGEHYHRLLPSLPAFRRKKAERFRFMRGKKLCAAAYLLLAYGLAREYGLSGPFAFVFNEYGKPALRDYPHIHFNMSHCVHGAACAVSDREVGLDMQEIVRFNGVLARRVCSDDEFRSLLQSENPDRDFCRLWTQKESTVKLLGTGISVELTHILDTANVRRVLFDGPSAQYPVIISCAFLSRGEMAPEPVLDRVNLLKTV
jgi:4'-phosphopantetheinyl transferase